MLNKKGKIEISAIIGILLFLGLIVGILQIVGLINIGALFGGDGTVIPINYEKELTKMCNSIDSEGFYNKEDLEKVTLKFEEFYNDDKNKSIDNLSKDFWEVFKDSRYCNNFICYINPAYKEKTIHLYKCKEKKYEEINLDDTINESIAEGMLKNACNNINSNGIYVNDEDHIKCGNYKCEITYYGKTYSKDCEKNGF